MKVKLLMVLLIVLTGWVYAQTWTRHLAWEDLVPAWEDHPVAEAYNVIPAIGGGYLMQGVLTIHEYDDYYINVFWKVSNGGEVLWRQDFYAPEDRISCLVSNGIDRYYALSPDYESNVLFEYDAQMNQTARIVIDTLFTNGERIGLKTMLAVDDGLVFGGRNRLNPFIMKLDNNLEPVWSRTYTTLLNSTLWELTKTPNNEFLGIAQRELMRFNSIGDTLWVNQYPSPLHAGYPPVYNNDGTISLIGFTNVESIYRFYDNGEFISIHPLQLDADSITNGACLTTDDGCLLIFEKRYTSLYSPDMASLGLLHKVSQTGEVLWSNQVLSYDNFINAGHGHHSIFEDSEGYYLMSIDNCILVRSDENGNAVTNQDPAIGELDVRMVRAYPNPAHSIVNFRSDNIPRSDKLRLTVYNLRGQIVYESDLYVRSELSTWEIPEDLANGVYMLRIRDGNIDIRSFKIMIAK